MTTIVNTPPSEGGSGNNAAVIVGVIIVLIIVLLLIFRFPFWRAASAPQQTGNTGNTINVPDQIDVNVTKPSP